MRFVGVHWLGITVLLTLALSAVTMSQKSHGAYDLFTALFALSFLVWAFRGFIRFLGRAWHHSATQGNK